MKTLLDDRLSPLTCAWGFIDARTIDVSLAARAWLSRVGRGRPSLELRDLFATGGYWGPRSTAGLLALSCFGALFDAAAILRCCVLPVWGRRCTGSLPELLLRLPPLAEQEPNAYLFADTDSAWTACFTNSASSDGLESILREVVEMLGCRGISLVCMPDMQFKSGRTGHLVRFGYYQPGLPDDQLLLCVNVE